jgi:hypothetical protein
MFDNVMQLLRDCNDFFSNIPKAKTAKIVRNIIDIVAKSPDSLDVQIALCKDVIEWCKVEKRTFLRQRIESKVSTRLRCIVLSHLLLHVACGTAFGAEACSRRYGDCPRPAQVTSIHHLTAEKNIFILAPIEQRVEAIGRQADVDRGALIGEPHQPLPAEHP